MARKVRIPTRTDDDSELEPPGGLSEERLALVNRYMADEEKAPVQPLRLVRTEEPPETRELPKEPLSTGNGAAPAADGEVVPAPARHFFQPEKPLDTTEQPREPAGALRYPERPGTAEFDRRAGSEVRELRAVAKADKQAAKEAARRLAALEKKEARERKALAKAAARRRSA
jgi:hypothetical protein